MKYSIVLEPQEEGGYTARCLELPGAISQGETNEAQENIKEAIGLILEMLSEDRLSGLAAGYKRTCRFLLE